MAQRLIHQTACPYHLTTNATFHKPLLADERLARRLSEIIREACGMHGFDLIIHAILPTHVHLLVWHNKFTRHAGLSGLENPRCGVYMISDLMKCIKGTFAHSVHRGRFWQPRYNFRIIDSESRLHNTFWYIHNNYLKHGLPERYRHEPYLYVAPTNLPPNQL
jgi:REP element-mobilizing transposase RayT